MEKVKIVAGPDTWIEGEAIRQLQVTAEMPGMRRAVAFPDVQPGKGSPSGAAFLSDLIYPDLIGTDGGCGMSLWTTTLTAHKAKPEKLAAKLDGLDQPWDGDRKKWLVDRGAELTEFDSTLGTPGYGNHFIEIQAINEIFDEKLFDKLGMDKGRLHLMVHSGSRGFGESILRQYTSQHGASGVNVSSDVGQHYIKQADQAVLWAVANRQLCAHRVFEAIGTEGKQLLDICHNSVTEAVVDGCRCWLHRKGSAPADKGPVVIPGSRGDLSYVVEPIAENMEALQSLAHGAGRKISRGEARGKIEAVYEGKNIKKNKYGGVLVCGDRTLLWEEAPECYKPISSVVNHLVDAGFIRLIASLRPSMVTFKTSEGTEKALRRDRKEWQRERDTARQAKRRR